MVPASGEALVARLVREFAPIPNDDRPLDPGLALNQLGIESLSLVSLLVRIGDELGVDVVESGVELGYPKTIGDLLEVVRILSKT
jgi:acyl carrier protein